MTEALWNRWVEEDGLTRAQRRAALLLFCTWTNYIVGGVCGAAIAPVFFWSLTPVAVLYAIGMISMQIEPAPPPDKEAREVVELRPRL